MLCLSVCSSVDTGLSGTCAKYMENLALQLRAGRLLLWCFPIDILKEVQSCSVVSPGIEAAACSQRPLIKVVGAEFLLFVFSELFIFLLNL